MALALQAERRVTKTKGQLRQLRADGKVPGIVYGSGEENVPIVVDERMLHPILAYHADSIVQLDIPGIGTKQVRIESVQRDCLVGKCEHIDFRLVRGEADAGSKETAEAEVEAARLEASAAAES
ncbi:hypothetical protein [Paenibacillus sp.]|uniref:hypothetical protein n=1 Tax=Paenibacillus sp. TaxID=58172 RepID=UPI0028116343|nr:hypothetical protein [Paenibacillus sp.]